MLTAIVMLRVEHGKVNEVAEKLAERPEISETYSVSGPYDLVAIVRVHENEALADLVTEHIARIEGIRETETMLAFRAYSRHDLEQMFSLGL
ncbi:MAG: Lrp/AsnC ligand binding domain-containing protein [Gammaproteobacteria bacterium]|nr:Lrp/AsnC ligand binding domain-containing protein [Gammaproteobacteria bacterium]